MPQALLVSLLQETQSLIFAILTGHAEAADAAEHAQTAHAEAAEAAHQPVRLRAAVDRRRPAPLK